MRTIDLFLLSQVDSFDTMLVGVGKHVFVLGVCLFHVPIEGRGCEHGFDRFERATIIESVRDLQRCLYEGKDKPGRLWIDQEDNNNPDEVQCGEEEVSTALSIC